MPKNNVEDRLVERQQKLQEASERLIEKQVGTRNSDPADRASEATRIVQSLHKEKKYEG